MSGHSRYRNWGLWHWGCPRFRSYSRQQPSAQTLFIYLHLGPHTTSLPGLFVAGQAGLAEALGWSLEDFRACWKILEDDGAVKADWDARVVWVVDAWKDCEPQNANQVKGWHTILAELPDCPLKQEARDHLFHQLAHRSALTSTLLEVLQPSQPSQETVCQTVPETVRGTVTETKIKISIKKPSPLPSPETVEAQPPPQEPRERERENKGPKKEEAAKPDTAPETKEAARRVVKHYQATVKPQTPPGGGDLAAMALLEAGETEERLRASADRYAAWCSRHDKAAQFREAAKTFFSPTGQCGAFLEDDPEAPKPVEYHRAAPRPPRDPNARPALLRDAAARMAAEEAAKAAADNPAPATPQTPQDAPPAPSLPEARLDRRSCQDGATAQRHGAGVGQAGRQQGGPRPIGAVLERAAQVAAG